MAGCQNSLLPIGGANRGIYCRGELLEKVQMSSIFPSCKTFVDMKMNCTPERILEAFYIFTNCDTNDSVEYLKMFIEEYFCGPCSELEPWEPNDWSPNPPYLAHIKDPDLKGFGVFLNNAWKKLGRRNSDSVRENPNQSSIINVPHPFIVPFSRAREFSYWDSYWIVRGLLYSGMHKTARSIIDNLLCLVSQYGYVPSGGRIYYSGRSQPPLLIPMIKAYVDMTKDKQYAINALPLLENEFAYFDKYHVVEVKGFKMYVYRDLSFGPRPESYREDVLNMEYFPDREARQSFYTNIKSACESGMNFSSRWFISENGTNEGQLQNTRTTSIVPVELNALMFRNSKILAGYYEMAQNRTKTNHYNSKACKIIKAIHSVLWSEDTGIWLDYDLLNDKPRPYFAASNFSPLWLKSYNVCDAARISALVMEYIQAHNLDSYEGGVPFTLNHSGYQWDFPNVWPPLMYMLIEGLRNLGTADAVELSRRWAHRWIHSNYESFSRTGTVYKMYNCEIVGAAGEDSEPWEKDREKAGFGWTNGILIEFLVKYGKEISLSNSVEELCSSKCRSPVKRDIPLIGGPCGFPQNNCQAQLSKSIEPKPEQICVVSTPCSKATAPSHAMPRQDVGVNSDISDIKSKKCVPNCPRSKKAPQPTEPERADANISPLESAQNYVPDFIKNISCYPSVVLSHNCGTVKDVQKCCSKDISEELEKCTEITGCSRRSSATAVTQLKNYVAGCFGKKNRPVQNEEKDNLTKCSAGNRRRCCADYRREKSPASTGNPKTCPARCADRSNTNAATKVTHECLCLKLTDSPIESSRCCAERQPKEVSDYSCATKNSYGVKSDTEASASDSIRCNATTKVDKEMNTDLKLVGKMLDNQRHAE